MSGDLQPLPSSGKVLCRKSDFDDAQVVSELFEALHNCEDVTIREAVFEAYKKMFDITPSISDIHKTIELSYLSISVEDSDGNVRGFASFDDCPPGFHAPSYAGNCWEEWMSQTYGKKVAESVHPRDTLWLRMYIGPEDTPEILREILSSVFITYPTINNICMVNLAENYLSRTQDPNTFDDLIGPMLDASFQRLSADFEHEVMYEGLAPQDREVINNAGNQWIARGSLVYLCHRLDIVKPLLMRRALVEDHDDIVKIFDAQAKMKTTNSGEFFIADLIAAQTQDEQALVAQGPDGRALGLVSVTTSVDIAMLHETFDLEPYELLVKPDYFARLRERFLATAAAQEAASKGDFSKMTTPDGLVDPRLYGYSQGDFFQHALFQLDSGIKTLVGGSPDAEDLNLMNMIEMIKHNVTITDDVAMHLRLESAIELALWQFNWRKSERYQGTDTVEPNLIDDVAKAIIALIYKTRQQLAERVQSFWPILAEIVNGITAEQRKRYEDAVNRKRKAEQAAARGGGQAQGSLLSKKKDGDAPGPSSDLDIQIPDVTQIDYVNVIDVLSTWSHRIRSNAQFPPEYARWTADQQREYEARNPSIIPDNEMASIIMALHWWGGLSIDGPDSRARWVEMESALQKLLRSEEDNILVSFGNPAWLSYVPTEQRSCVGVSLFCLDATIGAQSHEFLRPIFSLFPDKDYLVFFQKSSDPLSPLLQHFTPVAALPTSNSNIQLFVIHRASLLPPPVVRLLRLEDEVALDTFVSSSPAELQKEIFSKGKQFVDNCLELRDLKQRQVNLRCDPVFVATVEDQIVGFMEVSRVAPAEVDELVTNYNVEEFCLPEVHDAVARTFVEQQRLKNLSEAEALTGGTPTIPSFVPPSIRENAEALIDDRNISTLGREYGRFVQMGSCLFNPIFRSHQRYMLKEALRLMDASCFLLQTSVNQEVPDVAIEDFVQVSPRPEPRLRLRARDNIQASTFERVFDPNSLAEHDPKRHTLPVPHTLLKAAELRRKTSTLSMLPKRLLAVPKEGIHSRLVIVGASDAGLGFLEGLLSFPHLLFTRITLVTPGGINEVIYENGSAINTSLGAAFLTGPVGSKVEEEEDPHKLLSLPTSVMVNRNNLRRQLLGIRVRVVDARLVTIDRKENKVALSDGSLVSYDRLILASGLPEATLHDIKIRSWGTDAVAVPEGYSTVNGAFSVSDPMLPGLFSADSVLVKGLTWNPLAFCTIYGRSLEAFATAEALLAQDVPPYKVVLVLPPRKSLRRKWERYNTLVNHPTLRTLLDYASVGSQMRNQKEKEMQTLAVFGLLVSCCFGTPQEYDNAKAEFHMKPSLEAIRGPAVTTLEATPEYFEIIKEHADESERIRTGKIIQRTLAIPDESKNEDDDNELFEEGDPLEERVISLLEQRGARVLRNHLLVGVQQEALLMSHSGANNGFDSIHALGGGLSAAAALGQLNSAANNANSSNQRLKRVVVEDFVTLPNVGFNMWREHSSAQQAALQAVEDEAQEVAKTNSNQPVLAPNPQGVLEAFDHNVNLKKIRQAAPGFDHPRLKARRQKEKRENDEKKSYENYISQRGQTANSQRSNSKPDHPATAGANATSLADIMEISGWSPITSRLTHRIQSRALICAGRRGADPVIFEATHGAGLVYDGRLVVDTTFRTADANIFAGGAMARFGNQCRLRDDQVLRHEFYNGHEVGTTMALAVTKFLDPLYGTAPNMPYADPRVIRVVGAVGRVYHTDADASTVVRAAKGTLVKKPLRNPELADGQTNKRKSITDDSPRRYNAFGELIVEGAVIAQPETAHAGREGPRGASNGVPLFSQPIVRYAVLPGGLHFFTGRIGAPHINSEASVVAEVLETDTMILSPQQLGVAPKNFPGRSGEMARIEILADGRVGRVTFIGLEPLAPEAVAALVGMPSSLLNQALQRFRADSSDKTKKREELEGKPNLVDFLSQAWADALYLEKFHDAFQQMKLDAIADPQVRATIGQAVRNLKLKPGEAIGVQRIEELCRQVEFTVRDKVEGHTINLLRRSKMGHTYFLPEQWADRYDKVHM